MRVNYVVAVYECNQAYGGPEEGGWWYDSGSLIRIVRLFKSLESAYVYAQRLNKRLDSRSFGPNFGRHEYTSVLSEGEYQALVLEDSAPKTFPERRPFYE